MSGVKLKCLIQNCVELGKVSFVNTYAFQLFLDDTGAFTQQAKGAFPDALSPPPPFRHLTGFPAGSHCHRDFLTAQLVLD